MTHTLLALLLLLSDVPAPLPARVQTLDLGKLTFAEAQRLNGKPVRIAFVVDSFPEDIDGETLVDAKGKADASPSVRFPRGLDPGKLTAGQTLTVEGVVKTRLFPAIVVGGVPLFDEVRRIEVRDARPLKP